MKNGENIVQISFNVFEAEANYQTPVAISGQPRSFTVAHSGDTTLNILLTSLAASVEKHLPWAPK